MKIDEIIGFLEQQIALNKDRTFNPPGDSVLLRQIERMVFHTVENILQDMVSDLKKQLSKS